MKGTLLIKGQLSVLEIVIQVSCLILKKPIQVAVPTRSKITSSEWKFASLIIMIVITVESVIQTVQAVHRLIQVGDDKSARTHRSTGAKRFVRLACEQKNRGRLGVPRFMNLLFFKE
ncbi:hypothetical protein SAMN04488056_101152 [Cohaesibacter marisflavi]|uniref:Uncharacterized protein n=1 Tax=Cohaesibacter marisflavi TaxID=655353 RepID=A0A1I4ZNE6_9HYPH|nr:hypothetical protein SAMN04488056_101152 [Cohaesibacter marisflavi]